MTMVARSPVPVEKIPWKVLWPEYRPIPATFDFSGKEWADPDIGTTGFSPKFNQLDGMIDRRSHTGLYEIINGYPANPCGRTGTSLRGRLGRWGPNHAADPIVTKWKRTVSGQRAFHEVTGKPMLSLVVIKRRDTGEWALPGGMVDPGEQVSQTLMREFMEEALDSLNLKPNEKQEKESQLQELFKSGKEVFKGIVEKDPRNTDNAWMETVAYNFHDESGKILDTIELQAGDDASHVKWQDLSSDLKMYASHSSFIQKVAEIHEAHW